MRARQDRRSVSLRLSSPRRGPLLALPLAILLGCLASACSSAKAAVEDASEPTGWELVCRKPSGEPFTSLEVEQLGSVLRARLGAGKAATRVGVTAGAQGRLFVALPDVASREQALALRPRIERVGRLAFEGVATPGTPGWSGRDAEIERLETWWKAQAEPSLKAFNALPRDAGGPPPSVCWRPARVDAGQPTAGARTLPLTWPCERVEVVHPDRDWVFTARDLGKVYRATDDAGYPAIGFELKPERREAFGDFTEAYIDRQLAIVLDEVVLSAPVINDALRGPAMIFGRFEEAEVDAMVDALRGGVLPVALELVEVRPLAPR